MDDKKIFFVADAQSIHTTKWVNYFVEQKYDVYIATFSRVNNTKCTNIFFLSNKSSDVRGGNYHYLFSIRKLAKMFKDTEPDIINAHYSYSMGLIALLAKKISKCKASLSVVCHGSDILSPPKPFIFSIVNRYVLSHADKIFAVSDQIKDKLLTFDIDLNKVFVGQYGIDVNVDFENQVKDIDIISNRNYTPNSRIDFLLDVLKVFENKDLKIVFVLPHIDEEKFNALSKKYTYIKFYKQMEYNKMLKLVSRAKIYISATQSDGTALSLLEAMKLRCIPLISNIVSNRSWVLDGINGYLFHRKIDFEIKLKNILDLDTDAKLKMININQKLISDKANYRNQMKKIEKFLV